MFTHHFLDLANGVVSNPLKCDHELHGIEVIDIVVPVRRKASPTGNHEPYVGIAIERMPVLSEIGGTPVLSLRDVCTDMLACQIPVEGHMFYRHLFIQQ